MGVGQSSNLSTPESRFEPRSSAATVLEQQVRKKETLTTEPKNDRNAQDDAFLKL